MALCNDWVDVLYDNLLRPDTSPAGAFPSGLELRVGKGASASMSGWVEASFTGYAAHVVDIAGGAGAVDFGAPSGGSGSTQVVISFGTNGGASSVASTEFAHAALRDTDSGLWIAWAPVTGLQDLNPGDTLRVPVGGGVVSFLTT